MTYNTHGIILKYRDIGEHERIYTVLTSEHGKIEGWAQGVRKPQSKLVAHLQPLYLCDFMFARGRRFDRIAQVRVLNRQAHVWSDLDTMGQAVYAASLVDMVLRPGTRESEIFELLVSFLELHNSPQPSLNLMEEAAKGSPLRLRGDRGVTTIFSLKLLKESGFTPQLYHCVVCKHPVQGLSRLFDAIRGGVLCNDCFRSGAEHAFPVSSLTIEALEMILTSPLASLEMPELIRQELTQIARAMVSAHFGEEPRAHIFMDLLTKELSQMAAV